MQVVGIRSMNQRVRTTIVVDPAPDNIYKTDGGRRRHVAFIRSFSIFCFCTCCSWFLQKNYATLQHCKKICNQIFLTRLRNFPPGSVILLLYYTQKFYKQVLTKWKKLFIFCDSFQVNVLLRIRTRSQPPRRCCLPHTPDRFECNFLFRCRWTGFVFSNNSNNNVRLLHCVFSFCCANNTKGVQIYFLSL